MNTIAALIILSSVGAWICARSRAAGPALFFGVVAVVLICATPLGSWIPDALTSASNGVADAGGRIVSTNAGGAR